MTPKVSVIIPVYNGERFLEKAIISVTRQTAFDLLELILVNDGSTDGTREICDEYSSKFSNISALHCSNAGVSAARNNGIAKAKGEYITFLDSDDTYEASFIEKMLEHGDCDLVCCDYYCEAPDEKNLSLRFNPGKVSRENFDVEFYKKTIRKQFYSCWNKLYKRKIIQENNISFPNGVKYGEDMMFVFEYLKHCEDFYFVEDALYFYNVNPYNATIVIKDGYEVNKNNFIWQTEYFKSIGLEEMLNPLQGYFVYRSIYAINSAITYNSFFAALKKVDKIISDPLFYEGYMEENYVNFKCKYDEIFFKLLKKKRIFAVVVWRKIFDLRSRLLNGKSN